MTPAEVDRALLALFPFSDPNCYTQSTIRRMFRERMVDFLSHCPAMMTVGDLQIAMHHACDADENETKERPI